MPSRDRAAPVSKPEFAALMALLEPFESSPDVAVAVSGGRDSMALLLLACEWIRSRGGSLTALTVDHGLRPDSKAEARRVAAWCRRLNVDHRTLSWEGPIPSTGLQEAARHLRYELLLRWCRRRGVLHLLLAHQVEDQAETVLMRQRRRSGPDGLAGMSSCRLECGVRLLRPLLTIERERLEATLSHHRQEWLDDPSNEDPNFERVRVRQELCDLRDDGAAAAELAAAARAAGFDRKSREEAVARLIARAVAVAPAGYALMDIDSLIAAPPDTCRAALRQLVMCIGGRQHPPRSRYLDNLQSAFMVTPKRLRRTLSGCRFLPWRGALLVARETRNMPPPIKITARETTRWDRFECRLAGSADDLGESDVVRPLGIDGWALAAGSLGGQTAAIPAPVRATLPSLWDGRGPLVVPHLGYRRPDAARLQFFADFKPSHKLVPEPFSVALPPIETM